MKLPKLQDLDISNKAVIVRADLDVGSDVNKGEDRLRALLDTLIYLADRQAKITVIGHRGRPGGKIDEKLSLKPVGELLEKLLKKRIGKERLTKLSLQVQENLRFNPGERENNVNFAKSLSEHGEYFINDAFANSHRKHASIETLPLLEKYGSKKGLGFHFQEEIKNLERVFKNPKQPVISVIGGVKRDKISHIEGLLKFSDLILIGGRLPEHLKSTESKVIVAKLTKKGTDVDQESINIFKEKIVGAGTIILSGPMGKYEESSSMNGTKEILNAISSSSAFKIAGGGETENALDDLGLLDKFNWISSGGGAMLEFLSKGILPGIKALQASKR